MKKTLKIEGMMCNHCKAHVEKALNALEGVNAHVNLEEHFAKISSPKPISDEELRKVIEDAGYKLISIEE